MHLTEPAPKQPVYFIRSTADDRERGPFSIDHLRDLAEFANLTPDFLIRLEGSQDYQPLREMSDLLAMVYPTKETIHIKPHQPRENAEAAHDPVDAGDIYRCGPSPSTQAAPIHAPPHRPATTPNSDGFNPKLALEESEAIAKARRAERGVGDKPLKRKSFQGSFFFRWALAAGLFGLTIWIWSDAGGAPIGQAFSLLIGLFPLTIAIALTAGDILDWIINRVESSVIRDCPEAIDYTQAESCFEAEDWEGAADAYWSILQQDSHQLRAYMQGIAAAVAGGDERSLAAFQASALKHLSAHDRNLLQGSLARCGLPPLPAASPAPGNRMSRRIG